MSPGNPRGCSQTVLNRLHVLLDILLVVVCKNSWNRLGRHFCVVFCARKSKTEQTKGAEF